MSLSLGLNVHAQGMNAAFEDVMVLCDTIDACNNDLAKAVPLYGAQRAKDGEAIATLSMGNYREMRHSSGSVFFRMQKKFEGVLNWAFPEWWIPLYKMVAFTSIPYSEAIARAEAQDRALERAGIALKVGTGALALYAAATHFGLLPISLPSARR
jgi:kynurenine 3-monooxygenase